MQTALVSPGSLKYAETERDACTYVKVLLTTKKKEARKKLKAGRHPVRREALIPFPEALPVLSPDARRSGRRTLFQNGVLFLEQRTSPYPSRPVKGARGVSQHSAEKEE